MQSVLIKNQKKEFRHASGEITVFIRYDDDCNNGHNTFSITAHMRNAWGCLHEDIVKYYPEFAPLIKWHLCSSDGPLHYLANTTYLAGDKDCWGLSKGEKKIEWKEGNPIVRMVGEGKERELDAARRSAIWLDATDDELTATKQVLELLLKDRLPQLLAEFKLMVESLGFIF